MNAVSTVLLNGVRDVLALLALVWITGMALSIVPTAEALARLAEGDPRKMCDGCRSRRSSQLRSQREWAALGRAGPRLMVLAIASLCWLAPFIPSCGDWQAWRIRAGEPAPGARLTDQPGPDRQTTDGVAQLRSPRRRAGRSGSRSLGGLSSPISPVVRARGSAEAGPCLECPVCHPREEEQSREDNAVERNVHRCSHCVGDYDVPVLNRIPEQRDGGSRKHKDHGDQVPRPGLVHVRRGCSRPELLKPFGADEIKDYRHPRDKGDHFPDAAQSEDRHTEEGVLVHLNVVQPQAPRLEQIKIRHRRRVEADRPGRRTVAPGTGPVFGT
jgi:hypothetical protein